MKKSICLLPLCLLLIGCQETPLSSISESASSEASSSITETNISSSLEDSSIMEEVSSVESAIEHKTYILEVSDFPLNDKGGYPEDSTITAKDGLSYYIHHCMQGGGDNANTIQMRKEDSYFYSNTALKGSLTFTIKRKIVEYNGSDVTGVPSLYVGSEKHPSEDKVTLTETVSEDGLTKTFKADIDGYFTLADESSYAMYLTSFIIEC